MHEAVQRDVTEGADGRAQKSHLPSKIPPFVFATHHLQCDWTDVSPRDGSEAAYQDGTKIGVGEAVHMPAMPDHRH